MIQMSKPYMVEEAYLHHDIWGSDFINWCDAGGTHAFQDVISDSSKEQGQKLQLLYQQPFSVFYFSTGLFEGGWTHGVEPYYDDYLWRDRAVLGGYLKFAAYAIRDWRTSY